MKRHSSEEMQEAFDNFKVGLQFGELCSVYFTILDISELHGILVHEINGAGTKFLKFNSIQDTIKYFSYGSITGFWVSYSKHHDKDSLDNLVNFSKELLKTAEFKSKVSSMNSSVSYQESNLFT